MEKQPKRNKGIQPWRQRFGILRGTAISENNNESLSAHLVTSSIAKNVTSIQLSHWLAEKGLHVVSCDSLSYKIAIKFCDYEKAKNVAGRSRSVVQNITSKERKKNSGVQTYQEFKPKSILRRQSKQTHLSANSMLMTNNPSQLHNASQAQNKDFSVPAPK